MNGSVVKDLAGKIDLSILPLITSDYVLWGLPYYVNPGDTLIWQGTLEMLGKCRHTCLGTCGWDEYEHVQLDRDTVILILGGGYFGDVWRKAWDHVMDTVTLYPDNPIIILPQSIHYDSMDMMESDSRRLAGCKKLTICARDLDSFNFASEHFKNDVLLVPDMAFHLNISKLKEWAGKGSGKALYLKRGDKELSELRDDMDNDGDVDCMDWPAMQTPAPTRIRMINAIYRRLKKHNNRPFCRNLEGWVMYSLQRRTILKDSVKFIGNYKSVYSTRLHAMILAFLLDKEVHILDNSYGKLSSCYKTWLTGCSNIHYHD